MKKIYLQLLWLFLSGAAVSQTKIYSVTGSSTAAGIGASVLDSSWVKRLTRYYQSAGLNVIANNLAVLGRNCYQGMPNGYIPPPNRDFPQVNDNITMALTFSPEVVIVSYPSNNYNAYSISEIMDCLQTMKNTVNAQGKVCYVTTSQPRQDASFPDLTARTRLKVISDSIMNRFGNFAIDFFNGIANADYTINTMYSYGDGVHLNDAGHRVLFERVRAKNIFNIFLPVKLSNFSADPLSKNVFISWKVIDESPGIEYSIQRSKDGVQFENVFVEKSVSTKVYNSYNFIDKPGVAGVYFYRLMIDENGRKLSSATKKVIINEDLSIRKFISSSSKLRFTIASDERHSIDIRLLNTAGAAVFKLSQTLNVGLTDIDFSTHSLPAGLYVLEIISNSRRLVHDFVKK